MRDNVERKTKSDKAKKTKKLYGKYTSKYIRKKIETIEKTLQKSLNKTSLIKIVKQQIKF